MADICLQGSETFSRFIEICESLEMPHCHSSAKSLRNQCKNLRIVLELECLFATFIKEVTGAVSKMRPMEILCVISKERSPNSLAEGCG